MSIKSSSKYLEKLIGKPLSMADLLNSIRLCDELTMAAFSKKLKISTSHLNDIEKGRKFVSIERAAEFAKKLGYSKEQFVRISIQDKINKANLKLKIKIEAA